MKKRTFLLILPLMALVFAGCDSLQSLQNSLTTDTPLTEEETARGLKSALEVGTGKSVDILSKRDGYFKDPLVKILFPPEAQQAADKLRQLGMGKLVDDFEESMNRGAEKAAVEAKPIFVNAIKQMSIRDAKNILFGADDAATQYFQTKTRTQLYNAFSPKVKTALDEVYATKYWTDITTTYNKIPLVKPVETDLVKYTTDKALDGLFSKVAIEEKKIRDNPAARINELLKRVFGKLDKK